MCSEEHHVYMWSSSATLSTSTNTTSTMSPSSAAATISPMSWQASGRAPFCASLKASLRLSQYYQL